MPKTYGLNPVVTFHADSRSAALDSHHGRWRCYTILEIGGSFIIIFFNISSYFSLNCHVLFVLSFSVADPYQSVGRCTLFETSFSHP